MNRLKANRNGLAALVFALLAAGFGARDAGYLGGSNTTVITHAAKATAMTIDMRDLDIDLSLPLAERITRTVSPIPPGKTADLAPLMTGWDNDFVIKGEAQTWCLDGVNASVARTVRQQLNILADAYPPPSAGKPGIAWREACPGAYVLGETAQTECGDMAVACAIYYGSQSGKLSVNGNLLKAGLLDRSLNIAIAHELGHLQGSLDHNGCGKIVDPATHRPVPSAMTPVDLQVGSSCSDPPAFGFTPDDWGNAITRYHLTPANAVTAPVASPGPPTVNEPPGLPPKAHPSRPSAAGSGGRTAPTFTAYNLSVVGAIADEADRLGLPPLWVLSMGAQEGGLACPPTCPTGDLDLDARGSLGTFQIYCVVHPSPTGDCRYWQDPTSAMREMASRWKWAYGLCAGGFLDDPHGCLITSIPQAQGSIGWTQAIASGAFRVALIAYIDLLQSRGAVVPVDMAAALTVAATGLDDIALRAAVQAEALRKAAGGP